MEKKNCLGCDDFDRAVELYWMGQLCDEAMFELEAHMLECVECYRSWMLQFSLGEVGSFMWDFAAECATAESGAASVVAGKAALGCGCCGGAKSSDAQIEETCEPLRLEPGRSHRGQRATA